MIALLLVMLCQSPTPLGDIKRTPYVAPEPEITPPAPQRTVEEQPRPRVERTRIWWQPLPPGWVACSIDPYGRNVCGNGYWVAVP